MNLLPQQTIWLFCNIQKLRQRCFCKVVRIYILTFSNDITQVNTIKQKGDANTKTTLQEKQTLRVLHKFYIYRGAI